MTAIAVARPASPESAPGPTRILQQLPAATSLPAGYDRWIGCEYKPAGRTEDGLGWLAPYR